MNLILQENRWSFISRDILQKKSCNNRFTACSLQWMHTLWKILGCSWCPSCTSVGASPLSIPLKIENMKIMENRKKKTQAPISLPSMHAVQLEKRSWKRSWSVYQYTESVIKNRPFQIQQQNNAQSNRECWCAEHDVYTLTWSILMEDHLIRTCWLQFLNQSPMLDGQIWQT